MIKPLEFNRNSENYNVSVIEQTYKHDPCLQVAHTLETSLQEARDTGISLDPLRIGPDRIPMRESRDESELT